MDRDRRRQHHRRGRVVSPLDIPFSLAAIALGAGAFVGFFALVGLCALVDWIKR